ncbi:efflux RND transporter permease subunit, partial [Chitinimonas sp.]|uniref:efflux RND transporter permease subunit n=1 Tax=Chitinimonas sp. TaxID=1934313 RepID=UPI0035B26937
MKLKVSSWAISNPTPVILLFLLLALAGMMALGKLPIAGNPRVELPIVSVLVSQPGASTEELEGNVARRLEDAVVGVAGIKHMSTSIANGTVDLTIEFMLETPVDRAVSNVRDAVAMVRPQLPSSVSEPVVSLLDISGGALQNYMVRSDTLSEAELSRLVDERVVPRLLAVPGVGQVKREGGSQREFRVELDPARMVAANLSVGEVLRQLRGAELNAPAGMVSTGSGRLMPIRVMGASHSLAELARRPIALAGGKTVALGELGRVLDSEGEASDFALLNGQPGMGLALYKKRGASELTLASGVSSAIAQLAAEEPRLKIEQFYDGVEYTRQSFEGARDTLIEGVVLTVLVVWLFLRNLRATAIAAAAIPLSLLPTFVAMHWRGFQLDSVTLLALILVIGILVDDAIVEIENIERRIEAGETPRQAAMVGADALGLAVLAITLTIVAVFLPVSFINGVVGKYFTAFGLTTTFAVLASLVVARLLTPLMCAHWLKPKHHAKPAPSAMERGYARALSWALAHPRRALAGGGAVLLLTLGLLAMIPSGFLPKTTAASLDVQYRIAPDAPLSEGLRAAETLRHALHGLPDVSGVFAHQQSGADSGKLTLLLVPKNQRSLPQSELE